jgi:hypothetical protein
MMLLTNHPLLLRISLFHSTILPSNNKCYNSSSISSPLLSWSPAPEMDHDDEDSGSDDDDHHILLSGPIISEVLLPQII